MGKIQVYIFSINWNVFFLNNFFLFKCALPIAFIRDVVYLAGYHCFACGGLGIVHSIAISNCDCDGTYTRRLNHMQLFFAEISSPNASQLWKSPQSQISQRWQHRWLKHILKKRIAIRCCVLLMTHFHVNWNWESAETLHLHLYIHSPFH